MCQTPTHVTTPTMISSANFDHVIRSGSIMPGGCSRVSFIASSASSPSQGARPCRACRRRRHQLVCPSALCCELSAPACRVAPLALASSCIFVSRNAPAMTACPCCSNGSPGTHPYVAVSSVSLRFCPSLKPSLCRTTITFGNLFIVALRRLCAQVGSMVERVQVIDLRAELPAGDGHQLASAQLVVECDRCAERRRLDALHAVERFVRPLVDRLQPVVLVERGAWESASDARDGFECLVTVHPQALLPCLAFLVDERCDLRFPQELRALDFGGALLRPRVCLHVGALRVLAVLQVGQTEQLVEL